jgi:large subunit ribosomal protein L6
MRLDKIEEKISIPEDVNIEIIENTIKVKGPKGELKRILIHPKIKFELKDNTLNLSTTKPSQREKTMINTFKAHIKNMIKGVKENYIYKMKICSGHFPMNVSIKENNIIINNFLGEKIPRKSKILPNVKIDIQGDIIILESNNKESVGQTAANIEQATRVTNRDRRIFQDGIFIIEKAGKKIK